MRAAFSISTPGRASSRSVPSGDASCELAPATVPPPGLPGGGTGAGVPCLYSNNSTETQPSKLTAGQRKTAFALERNIETLAVKYGIGRVGFLTLTFADHVTDPREAQRRFNSLRTHVLAFRYLAWVRVFERQASGRIHYHLLVVLNEDIRTGVSFEELEKGVYQSAGSGLRAEWNFWRRTAKQYRFGRTELLPVKSTAQALSRYVGKYIGKHVDARIAADKGVRLVEYSRGWKTATARCAWATPGGWLWRKKLECFATQNGCKSMDDLRRKFGRRWAWRLSKEIDAVKLETTEDGTTHSICYPTHRHAEKDGRRVSSQDVDATWITYSHRCVSPASDVGLSLQAQPEGPSGARELPSRPSPLEPSPSCINAAGESAPETPADFLGRTQLFTGQSRCAGAQPLSIERDRGRVSDGLPPGAIEAQATRPATGITKAKAREYVIASKSDFRARRARMEWVTKGQLL